MGRLIGSRTSGHDLMLPGSKGPMLEFSCSRREARSSAASGRAAGQDDTPDVEMGIIANDY